MKLQIVKSRVRFFVGVCVPWGKFPLEVQQVVQLVFLKQMSTLAEDPLPIDLGTTLTFFDFPSLSFLVAMI